MTLKDLLDALFLYHRDCFMGVDWPLPDYEAEFLPDGRVRVTTAHGPITGALAAWLEFPGRFWAPEVMRRYGVALGGFMSNFEEAPKGRRPSTLKNDYVTRLFPLLQRMGDFLLAQGHHDAAFDVYYAHKIQHGVSLKKPDDLRPDLLARLKAHPNPFDRDKISLSYGAARFAAVLGDPATEIDLRRVTWYKACGFLSYYSDRDPLQIQAKMGAVFAREFPLADPLENQLALWALHIMAYDLWSEKAYAEAIPHLEILCRLGVGLPENDYRLAECYLALDRADAAQPYLERLRALGPLSPVLPLSGNFFFAGDVEDARAVAFSRAAYALTLARQGADPCKFRKIKKTKTPPKPDPERDRARLERINAYFTEAHAHIKPRAEAALAQPAPEHKNMAAFYADHYFRLGFFMEQIGKNDVAQKHYAFAVEFDAAFGLNWNNQRFADDLARVTEKLKS